MAANLCFSHLPAPPPQLWWKEAGKKVTRRRRSPHPLSSEGASQPGLQQGAPCPAPIPLKAAGTEANTGFPYDHVCLHTVQTHRDSLPKSPPPGGHLEPPGQGLSRAAPLRPARQKGLNARKARLLNSTEVSLGATREEGGARSPVQSRRGSAGVTAPIPRPPGGLTCWQGCGAGEPLPQEGEAGAGAAKPGALAPPRRH